jgi:hypothetical protein
MGLPIPKRGLAGRLPKPKPRDSDDPATNETVDPELLRQRLFDIVARIRTRQLDEALAAADLVLDPVLTDPPEVVQSRNGKKPNEGSDGSTRA